MKKILYKILMFWPIRKLVNYLLNKQFVFRFMMRFLSEEKKEKLQIQILRENFAFFGNDLSDMTDEEIKKCISNVAKAIGSFGATKEEAEKAIQTLGKLGAQVK